MEIEGLKIQYLKDQIERGIQSIFEKQRMIASADISIAERRGRSRGADLMASINNPDYLISSDGSGVRARITYPIQIRFLDMKHLGNKRIYNRPIWGTLYRETLADIRYEFRDWLQRRFKESMAKSIQQ